MTSKLKEKITIKKLLFAVFLLLFASVLVLYISNYTLSVEHIELQTEKLPASFNGYKIAHVSDYHNNSSDIVTDDIIEQLETEKPDLIFFTGDLVDFRITDVERALQFVKKLVAIAPVYYVTGNHEAIIYRNNLELYESLISGLNDLDVIILENKSTVIKNSEGDSFTVHGINNQFFDTKLSAVVQKSHLFCSFLDIKEDEFNILLAHQPERIDVYSEYNFDAVFSGHAHGGQVRLFGKGVYAPDQGLFPEYTSGLYKYDGVSLIVSRGTGDSLIPIRVFNKHHLIITELKTK